MGPQKSARCRNQYFRLYWLGEVTISSNLEPPNFIHTFKGGGRNMQDGYELSCRIRLNPPANFQAV